MIIHTDKTNEMVFIHTPGADKMSLIERIKYIALRGSIKSVIVTQRDMNTIPTGGLIAWTFDPNRIINKQRI